MTNEPRTTPPLQNRVTPTGEIVSHPSRGLLMGNRGCIHNDDRTLGVSRWRTKMWISCVTKWRNVRRDVMPPGRWTALFFLDEATALSAGHRPCGYCRRADHRMFGECWRVAQGLAERPRAFEMDIELHAESGLQYDDWTMRRAQAVDLIGREPGYRYLRARGNSIEGGTSEILRNTISERILGLPGEHRVDKDIAWKDLNR